MITYLRAVETNRLQPEWTLLHTHLDSELAWSWNIRPDDLKASAPSEYKAKLTAKWREHIEWLQPQDQLGRATQGFESAIAFMNSTDNTHLIDTFWRKTYELDAIRNESCLNIIPELRALK